MHYKITIFGACAPYPRLIYRIVSSISQGKKDDMSSKSGQGKALLACAFKQILYQHDKRVNSYFLYKNRKYEYRYVMLVGKKVCHARENWPLNNICMWSSCHRISPIHAVRQSYNCRLLKKNFTLQATECKTLWNLNKTV